MRTLLRQEDKRLYKHILTLAVPMMIQNGISNFVSLLDNLMIGKVGTNELSGVAISNQLIFIYYLVIFGATAGVGIFTAQYYGKGDTEGVRISFRFKLMLNTVLSIGCILLFFFFSRRLISLFLLGEGDPNDARETLGFGADYMKIMLIGFIPLGITNAYSGTLRDTGRTKIPMIASVIAIFVNLIGNALLIYGLLGLPALGAKGAAIATVISRFAEMLILIVYSGLNAHNIGFIEGAFRSFRVPVGLGFRFFIRSLPLILNETLWAAGVTTLNQCYSYRSLASVAAVNIETTIWNLLCIAFLAMGEAVGIAIGHTLGSGDTAKARSDAPKLIGLTVFCGVICGLLCVAISPIFPRAYNTTDEIRHLATMLILIYGILTPIYAYTHVAYFTIRAGGNTFITFLFDSCFVWAVSVPTGYFLSRFTSLSVVQMVIIVQSLEFIKAAVGWAMIRSGIWARNIVKNTDT